MQREIEDLRLRLQMAAEHYKDKYKECQKLQKQVVKLSEQPGVSKTLSLQLYSYTTCRVLRLHFLVVC